MGLASVRKKLQQGGYSEAEIDECLRSLAQIYIGQHIRTDNQGNPQGILRYDIQSEEAVSILLENSLVEEDSWYSHNLFVTTTSGAEAGEELVRERIDEEVEDIPSQIGFQGQIIPFLIFDYIDDEFAFSKQKGHVRDWREPLLEETRVRHVRNQLFEELVESGLAVETHHYVSTRGGERRGAKYVISNEVKTAIQERVWPDYQSGIGKEHRWKCEAYQLLRGAPNYLDEADVEISRERYWERLDEKPFDEEYVERVIDDLSDDAVTSYRGLMSDSLPFEVLNESKYRIDLKQSLVEPVLDDLLGRGANEKTKVEDIKQGEYEADEIDLLQELAEEDYSPFENQDDHIRNQIQSAVDLYEDEYWSEFLLRINNVCEDLVLELYLQRGAEYSGDIEPLLDDSHRPRVEALANFSFVADNVPLKHRLLSIHLDRINSDAPHGGESRMITERDAKRALHSFLEIYIEIWDLLE